MSIKKQELINEFQEIIEAAQRLSTDVGQTVEEVLERGMSEPLSIEEARLLLSRVVKTVAEGATKRGDKAGMEALDRGTKDFIDQVLAFRLKLRPASARVQSTEQKKLQLQDYKGIEKRPIRPNPVFHEREVSVVEGFVRTKDIKIWHENERVDIHLNQFQQLNDRKPTSDEMLDIMLGKLILPGNTNSDQFNIQDLAKSIAVNGVRKPPIIDIDGTLLDGNRRLSACYFILNSTNFTPKEKQRAEWIQVWQLTEHATNDDREAVIVSLNFEPDFKQDWPKYVKARKVYLDWQAMLALEPHTRPNSTRQKEIKQDIARRFALSTTEVNRFIQMAELSEEFEDYHVAEHNKDKFSVKHCAQKYFEYFDELGKGKAPGGVYWSLNQDDAFKHLIFDLLFDGKFQNWNRIRDLKYVYTNEDALACLRRANRETDTEAGQDLVNDGCDLARTLRPEKRQQGANTRVKIFVDWFKDLPVKTFREGESGAISKENLIGLRDVLQLVDKYLNQAVVSKDG